MKHTLMTLVLFNFFISFTFAQPNQPNRDLVTSWYKDELKFQQDITNIIDLIPEDRKRQLHQTKAHKIKSAEHFLGGLYLYCGSDKEVFNFTFQVDCSQLNNAKTTYKPEKEYVTLPFYELVVENLDMDGKNDGDLKYYYVKDSYKAFCISAFGERVEVNFNVEQQINNIFTNKIDCLNRQGLAIGVVNNEIVDQIEAHSDIEQLIDKFLYIPGNGGTRICEQENFPPIKLTGLSEDELSKYINNPKNQTTKNKTDKS